jgi:hypothetical protein
LFGDFWLVDDFGNCIKFDNLKQVFLTSDKVDLHIKNMELDVFYFIKDWFYFFGVKTRKDQISSNLLSSFLPFRV